MARTFLVNATKLHYRIKKLKDDNTLTFKMSKVQHLNVKGYRVIHLDCLQSHVMDITMHVVATCDDAIVLVNSGHGRSPITLVSELRTCGLASVMLAKCEGCGKTFKFETSPKLKTETSVHYDINARAVW